MATSLTIHELGPKGDGVSIGPKGRIYVERATPGDRVRAVVHRDHAGIARGEIQAVLESSPHSQKAPCEHYASCGNCTVQHLKQEYYRAWKVELVKAALRKQGVRPGRWLEPLFVGPGDRRRITLSAVRTRHGVELGYYRRRSRRISDVHHCLVSDPDLLNVRTLLRPLLETCVRSKESTDFFLQKISNRIDLAVTGPLGTDGRPDEATRLVLEGWLPTTPVCRVAWRPHARATFKILAGKAPIAEFGPLRVALPPAAFLQPTRLGEAALVKAIGGAMPDRADQIADLFSGCGTFSGPLLHVGAVTAFEENLSAVQALSRSVGTLPLKAIRRDLFKSPLSRNELNEYDAIVFDPPRAGAMEQMVHLATSKVRTVVGVSCNPATFARDAGILCRGGYRLQSVQVIDQFLWSHHVEVVGVFGKKA